MSLLSNFDDNLNIVVIGASGGIGSGFIQHLLNEDKVKTLHALSRSSLDMVHEKLNSISIDITDEASVEKACNSVSQEAPLDIVIVATGMLHDESGVDPEKSLRDISSDNFEKIFSVNTIGPALIMKHFLPKLHRDRRSVFAALSARVGSISDNHLGGWYAYRASKSALNMLIRSASIEVARRHKLASIIGLHPGTVDTSLSDPFQANVPEGKLFTPEFATAQMLSVINEVDETQTGKVFAYDGSEIPA
jgi:NAD(P)-dependent dehydrogenase (short-subunit alcohol dehydrogenase family)